MGYKLKQPFTKQQYNEFINKYKNIYFMNIEEDNNCIYALRGDEIVVDGDIVKDPEYNNKLFKINKVNKINKNDINRDKKLLSGVVYSDVLFDSDNEQKINLLAKYFKMSDTDTVTWYGMDNQPLLCTKNDLMAIGQLIEKLHTYCWTRNAEIKQQIEQAQTLEELDEIDISYDEMDNK